MSKATKSRVTVSVIPTDFQLVVQVDDYAHYLSIDEANYLIDQLNQGMRAMRKPEEYSHPETCNCPLCSTPSVEA